MSSWNPFAKGNDVKWEVLARIALPIAALFAGIVGAVIAGHGQSTRLEELQNDRDSNVTDRYTKAIEQLSNEHVAVRIGGIYALERIAHDSDRDRKTIVRVLYSNLFRENREKTAMAKHEEVAIVLALMRMRRPGERNELESYLLGNMDFSSVDLSGAYLHQSSLIAFLMFGADLSRADLSEASLRRAIFYKANLDGSNLSGADMTGADLLETSVRWADLTGADLSGADLESAVFTGSKFKNTIVDAKHLNSELFTKAQKRGLVSAPISTDKKDEIASVPALL